MSELAIETTALRKTYRRRGGGTVGVESLDLHVPVGGVHGFLGPNGSGKTTTVRMLLGLIRPDSGTMRIFGHEVPRQLPEVIGRVGAIVESPKFFPTFTARRNLELLAGAIGSPAGKVDEVLRATALEERAGDRYKSYSLGMKQRLAIAATLLKSPGLLIFDEPTNGLDPGGIREVRETMRRLGAEGRTVLVSSHILAEVQQVADTVSIIGRGRLLAEGKVSDVISQRGTTALRVGVPDLATAMALAVLVVVLGCWLIASQLGLADGMGAEQSGGVAWTAARVVVLTAVVALLGAALGLLLRHTAAVLGLAVAYLIGEQLLTGLLPATQPWVLSTNVSGWVMRGTTYFSEECTTDASGTRCEFTEHALSFGHSAVYLLVVTVVVVVLGAAVFRRRDAA